MMETSNRPNEWLTAQDRLAWILLASVWLLAHPHAGLRDDALFYAVDALHRIDESLLAADLFFHAGSPFKASAFGPLYSQVVRYLGPLDSGLILYLAAQSLWAGAAIAWGARFLPGRAFLLATACLMLLPRVYSSELALTLAELSLTARSFAEPLTLLGLLAVAAGRAARGVVLLFVAALVHPIMALPGWFAALWLLSATLGLTLRQRVALAIAGMALVSVVAASGSLGMIDDDWLEATRKANPFILPSEWGVDYLARIGAPVLVLVAAARNLGGSLGVLCSSIAVAAVTGVALALSGEFHRAATILQAQPWRTLWLAFWAAPFAAAAVALRLWAFDRGRALMFASAVPAAALSYFLFLPGAQWLLVAHAIMLALWARRDGAARFWAFAGRAWLGVLAAVVAIALGAVAYAFVSFPGAREGAMDVTVRDFVARYFGWIVAPALLALVASQLARRLSRRTSWPLVIGLACASIFLVDGRSEAMREREARIASGLPEVRTAIGDADMVFWPENIDLVWFALRRPGYVSSEQMAAQMFDRGLSVEGRRRIALLGSLGGLDGLLDFRAARRRDAPSPGPDDEALRRICADRRTLAVVLDFPLGAPGFARRASLGDGNSVWVHRCAELPASGFSAR